MSIESLRRKLEQAEEPNRNQLTMITFGEIEDAIIEFDEARKTNPIEPQRERFSANKCNAATIGRRSGE